MTVHRLARSLALLLTGVVLFAPAAARAQTAEQRLRQQREELDAIRRERAELQSRLESLKGQAHDVADESQNLHRQAEATARLVRSLDAQLLSINADVDSTSGSLQRAEDEVDRRRLTLDEPLRPHPRQDRAPETDVTCLAWERSRTAQRHRARAYP